MTVGRRSILVVDDDADLRDLLETILTAKGFDVSCAANGREALDALDGRWHDLILLDMKMPVMDGWEFCRLLQLRGPHPPIVVVTAAPDPAARAAEVCAQGWLGKPFEYERVEAALTRFVPA
jgi:CheY-like chemotaxis protein